MGTQIKLHDEITLWPGEMIQVRDKERKNYTIKYEGTVGKNVVLKQMGRNTVKTFEVESEGIADWANSTYRKIEKVLKF